MHQNVCRMNCANVLYMKLSKMWVWLHLKGPKFMKYRVSRSDLNFWDSPQSIWKWHFGNKLRIFINLGLTIFVIFNGIPFLRCFIEIQGIRKIMLILLFSWNWVISYNEKCFKHYFSWKSTFFSVDFPFSREIATQ